MDEKDYFAILSKQLQKMEDIDEVDVSVVHTLDKLIENCKFVEQFWTENQEKPVDVSFLLYHASRNSRLVLDKMKQRFYEAEEKHENPRVIGDSLAVVPLLSELYFITSYAMKVEITAELRNLVSQRLRGLRNVALNVAMLPSPEEEKRGLDRKKLRRRFDRFSDTLQAMFVEM